MKKLKNKTQNRRLCNSHYEENPKRKRARNLSKTLGNGYKILSISLPKERERRMEQIPEQSNINIENGVFMTEDTK